MTQDEAKTVIEERLGAPVVADGRALLVTVPVAQWIELGRLAKETLGCLYFPFLTAVDWKDQGLEIVVRVENLDANFSVTGKTRLGPGVSTCPSLAPIYRGADWMERECYDMFGVRFEGHPDLRRILLPDDWEGHPLLKSYAVDTPYPPYR